jgi:hypothetical protein
VSADLRVVYCHSNGSWSGTLTEPTDIPVCPPGSLMLIADPGISWPSIANSIIGLKADLLADRLELNGVEDVPSLRSAA